MNDIQQLQEQVAKELGLDALPQDQQEAIIVQLNEQIIQRLTIAVLTELPEADRPEFDKISTAGDNTAIESFLREKIPTLDEISRRSVRQTIDEFKTLATSNNEA